MDCRDEVFTWRTAPTDLPDALQALIGGGGLPAGSTTERIWRTVHGPVQALGEGRAFARRYNTWLCEIDTLVGLTMLGEARDIRGVNRALRHVTWNENVMAADDRGHIGYWHPGRLPLRPKRWDERLPFPGTGKAEWDGFLRFPQRPHVIDPARAGSRTGTTCPRVAGPTATTPRAGGSSAASTACTCCRGWSPASRATPATSAAGRS